MSELYIGIMTGTSLDGVDIALTCCDDMQLIKGESFQLEPQLTKQLADLSNPQNTFSLSHIKQLEQRYTSSIAAHVLSFLDTLSAEHTSQIVAIGSHGLTISHEPDCDSPYTWQILDAHKLAVLTGLDVIYDFRSKDVALGGQGAPLVPMFHHALFAKMSSKPLSKPISKEATQLTHNCADSTFACLNLGGIANVSIWTHSSNDPTGLNSLIGFDTGPANTLLDLWALRHISQSYDKNGQWALTGSLVPELLEAWLSDPYFRKTPPKSTGKEYFNEKWLDNSLSNFEHSNKQNDKPIAIKPQDVQMTLCHLTAKSVVTSLANYDELKTLAVCGGGVHNHAIMRCLGLYLPNTKVCSTKSLGVCPDNLEAMAFAWLAYCRIHGETSTVTSVTGVSRPCVLGAWVVAA